MARLGTLKANLGVGSQHQLLTLARKVELVIPVAVDSIFYRARREALLPDLKCAVSSPRAIAPSDQRAPGGQLPGTAAPTPDTRGEER